MRACQYTLRILAFILFLGLACPLWGGIVDTIFYADKHYASNIEPYGWVITEAQLKEVFAKMEDPEQLTYRELYDERIYFLIRLQNRHCCLAWGTLKVFCPIHDATLDVLGLEPRLDENVYYVVPIGKFGFSKEKYDQKPVMSFKWKKLYVQ